MRKTLIRKEGYYLPVRYKHDIPWISECENAKYLGKTKTWFIPTTLRNTRLLESKGLIGFRSKRTTHKNMSSELLSKVPDIFYKVQIEALNFIYRNDSSAICAYDMGLGKTAIASVYASLLDFDRTIILCQANLKQQWARQITQWTGHTDIHIMYGRTPYTIPKAKFIILNYEILTYHVRNLEGDFLIIDEVQFFSNNKAKRTQALVGLGFAVGRVLALSGTPITRRPVQFFPILHILKPDVFPNFFKYTTRYCNAHKGAYGWVYDGVSNIDELRDILRDIMIRRTKADALDMPKKIINPIVLPVPDDLYQNYDKYEEELLEVFQNGTWLENKGRFTHLSYLAYVGKRDAVLSWLQDFLEIGEKILLFCVHRKVVEDIHEHFPDNSVMYYGGMTQEEKDVSKQQFLTDKQIMVGNVASMGTGLDGLQHICSTVGFIELPWTPTVFDQATDRVYRIGQEEHVNVCVFIAENTVEENIIEILDRSRRIVFDTVENEGAVITEAISDIRARKNL